MAGMIGADPGQLDDVARRLAASADRLDSVRSEVGWLLERSRWAGADADEFRYAWHHRLSGLLDAAALGTRDGATALRVHADQQREASGLGTVGGGHVGSYFGTLGVGMTAGAAGSRLFGTGVSGSIGRELPSGSVNVLGSAALVDEHGQWYSTGQAGDGGQWRFGYHDVDVDGQVGFGGNLAGAGFAAGAAAGLAMYRRDGSFTVAGQRVDGRFDATLGARANVDGFVGFRQDNGHVTAGARIGGDAFAGAEVRGSAETTILADVVGLQAHGSARAGLGLDGGATAMFDDGKLVLGAHLGAAVGLGFSGGFEVSVDAEQLVEFGVEAAGTTIELADDVADGLKAGWNGFWSSL